MDRYNVQYIVNGKNKGMTKVTAKDPKQAMRSIIHYKHGAYPEVIVWNTLYAYDNFITSGKYEIGSDKYSTIVAYIPDENEPVKMEKGEYGFSGDIKEINIYE